MKEDFSSFAFGSEDFRRYFRDKYVPVDAGFRFAKITNGRIYQKVVFLILLLIPLCIGSLVEFQEHHLWLSIGYFLFCNLLEYLLHRYPMHKNMVGLGFLFEHVTIHHNFFNGDKNQIDEDRDLMAVFLPIAYLLSISFIVFASSAVVYFVGGKNEATFFAFVAYCYYAIYEILHYSYHCNEKSVFRKIPFVKNLASFHLTHHQGKWMARYNFNITFPIWDLLLGTLYKGDKEVPRDKGGS